MDFDMIFDIQTPKAYLDLLIEEYWEFFPKNKTSSKHAMRVAMFAHHIHEFVWHYYSDSEPGKIYNTKTPEEYKKLLIGKCPEFEVVGELCNYAKHARLMRLAKGGILSPRNTASTAPEIRPVIGRLECSFTNIVGFKDGKPVFGEDKPEAFFVDTKSGSELRVDDFFRKVYNFWLVEFKDQGL